MDKYYTKQEGKMVLETNLRFNKAGQGLFYTGSFIFNNQHSFSFVYDCGTFSKRLYLREEIKNFKNMLLRDNNNVLDLLIISHFDADHVNEIHTLLKGLKECKQIILPYLTPSERMVLLIKHLISNSFDQEYTDFLIDPVVYLTRNDNVTDIVFISGNDDSEDNLEGIPEPVDINPEHGFHLDLKEIKGQEAYVKDYEYSSQKNGASVGVYSDKKRAFLMGIWEFYFFNKKMDCTGLINKLKERLSEEFPNFNSKHITKEVLEEMAKRNTKVIEIFEDELDEKINMTSLVILHGLIKTSKLIHFSLDHIMERFLPVNLSIMVSRTYTLLTGDIFLNKLVWPTYIKRNWDKILFIQIPHHGSKEEWDFKVIKKNSPSIILAIINFGLGNKHKHPSSNVIEDIITKTQWGIILNHELNSFNYYFEFTINEI